MPTEHHMPDESYNALVAEIMNTIVKPLMVIPDRVQELVSENQIKIALGQVGNIWLESVKG